MENTPRKKISIVTPTFNEEGNVAELIRRVQAILGDFPLYEFEHIFIDNASTDKTVETLKAIAQEDRRIKIIVNSRNFGQVRSTNHGLLQASGDAVVSLLADLQDPPEPIREFLAAWQQGYKIVIGVKQNSDEGRIMRLVRRFYYTLIKRIADIDQIRSFHGFGLYDREFMELFRNLDDPYPYFRGIVSEFGMRRLEVPYIQARRKSGKTSHNFYTLYDMAMLGFVSHSKVPLRLASFIGFGASVVCFILGLVYLIYKLLFWSRFQLGLAPLVIGVFFFASVQLFFIGIIGEYIGAIYTQVKKRPMVVERERVNFGA